MGLLIDVFHLMTFVIAASAAVCAMTSPPNNKWAEKAYQVMNVCAFNVYKAKSE